MMSYTYEVAQLETPYVGPNLASHVLVVLIDVPCCARLLCSERIALNPGCLAPAHERADLNR